MSDEEKAVARKGSRSTTSTPATYEATRCCATCGAKAIFDGRDEYTLCNCYSNSPWVNDGRGGYHTGGQIVEQSDPDDGKDPDDYFKYPNRDDDHR